jgi:hypothetical protein
MSALVYISQVLLFPASLQPRNTYLKKKDQNEHQRSPTIRVAHSLSRSATFIFGAIICLLANAEITSTLRPNEPEVEVGSDQRELAAATIYSFAYTGAVQTWC